MAVFFFIFFSISELGLEAGISRFEAGLLGRRSK